MSVPIIVGKDGNQIIIGPLGDQPCESTVFKVDFETDLNIDVTISGLTMGIHSHAGVTGFEDVILSFATTLGALDIKDEFVFAQPFKWDVLADGQVLPVCVEDSPGSGQCDLLFVKKRVEASISLGGVTFSNVAMIEDTTFPKPCVAGMVSNGCYEDFAGHAFKYFKLQTDSYEAGDQHFGFGDLLTIEGQTPSGITVTGETGICVSTSNNKIKKHEWDESVNRQCVGGVFRGDQVSFTNLFRLGGTIALLDLPGDGLPPVVKSTTTVEIKESKVEIIDNDSDGKISVGDQIKKTFDLRLFDLTDATGAYVDGWTQFATDPTWAWGGDCDAYGDVWLTPSNPTATCTYTFTIGSGFTTTYGTSKRIGVTVNFWVADGTVTKPPLLFDFEKLTIEDIPWAEGLLGSLKVECAEPILACEFTGSLTFTGLPLFSSIDFSFTFTNAAGPFTFYAMEGTIAGGPLVAILSFNADFTFDVVYVLVNFTLNPDTNPATLSIEAMSTIWAIFGVPAPIDLITADLSVTRAGLTFDAAATFFITTLSGGDTGFVLDELALSASAEAGIVTIEAEAAVGVDGLKGGNISATVNF